MFTVFFSSNCFASCNLDTSRWQWVTATDDFGEYFDTLTAKVFSNSAVVWDCMYFPYSCNMHPNAGEHYHYTLNYIDYGRNAIGSKSFMVRDSSGRVLENFTFPYVENYYPITPNSVAEALALAVRRRFARSY